MTNLQQPYAVVGSAKQCDIVVQGRGIERRSLLVVVTARGIRCVVLSAASKNAGKVLRVEPDRPLRIGKYAIAVNIEAGKLLGGEVGEATRRDTDVITSDDETDSAKQSDQGLDSTSEGAEAPMYAITWKEKGLRKLVRLHDESLLILGRKSPSHLRFSDERLSGVHCCLYRNGDSLWAIDLKSGNGTYVGAESVGAASVPLEKSVVLGKHRVHFVALHANEHVQQLRGRVQELTNARNIDRESLARADRQHVETSTELAVARDELAELQSSVGSIESQLEHAQQRLALSEQAIQSTSIELSEHQARNRELLEKLTNESTATKEAEQELSSLRDTVSDLEESEAGMQAEIDSLREQLSAAQQTQREAEEAHFKSSADFEQTVQAMKLEHDARESELEGLRKGSEELREQVAELSLELQQAKGRLESDSIREREAELERLKAELAMEREILRKLKLDQYVATESNADAEPASYLIDDETCIAAFDFQDILEEAMEGLPSIDEDG